MKKISVPLENNSYQILIGSQLIHSLPKLLQPFNYAQNWVIISQKNIFNYYGKRLINIFKDNKWHVSTQHYIDSKKIKDIYDDSGLWYQGKFEPVTLNKEYIKYKDKHEKHAEVKMISKIGDMLKGAGFAGDDIMIQGGNAKKSN